MAQPTSSRNRSSRRSSRPVTRGSNPQRANRQSISTAQVTNSGGGTRGSARVTNGAQRTSNGSARVTGGERPALPPGRRGGELNRQGAIVRTTGGRVNNSSVQPVRVRDLGAPTQTSVGGRSNRALPPGNRGGAMATSGSSPSSSTRAATPGRGVRAGGLREAAILAIAQPAVNAIGQAGGKLLAKALTPAARRLDDLMPGINSKDERRRVAARTPLRQMTPAERARAVRLPQAEVQASTRPASAPSRSNTSSASQPSRSSSSTRPSQAAPSRASSPGPDPRAGMKNQDPNFRGNLFEKTFGYKKGEAPDQLRNRSQEPPAPDAPSAAEQKILDRLKIAKDKEKKK